MRKVKTLGAIGLILAFGACDDLTDLEVVNQNNPDAERALANATDVESLIGGTFLTYWSGIQKSNPSMSLSTGADESSSSWGNFGMRDFSSEPRVEWNNASSYGSRAVNQTPWGNMYGVLSSAFDGLVAINTGLEIGANGVDNPRAMAWSKLMQGLAHMWLALQFDQAIVFDETVDLADAAAGNIAFSGYNDVMTAAYGYLDEAIALAQANTFTIPDGWISGTPIANNTEMIQFIRSMKARGRSQVGRTPGERAGADWGQILGDIAAGITDDFVVTDDGNLWWGRMTAHGSNELWNRADYRTIGWTDESGGYAAWLGTAVADRTPEDAWPGPKFEMDTRDLRIWGCGSSGDVGGQCRSADGTTARDARIGGTDGEADDQEPGLYFRYYGPAPHPASRGTYHWSRYHHWRYEDTFENNGGPMVYMQIEEMDLLRAEGLIRTVGVNQEVVDIINATRVGNGGLTAVTVANPQCPAILATCTHMDQMIYEKRMETFYTAAGLAFFDARGFGPISDNTATHHWGLITGTPAHFPLPGSELEVLQITNYTYGGPGNEIGDGTLLQPGASLGNDGQPLSVAARALYVFEDGMTIKDKLEFVREKYHGTLSAAARVLTRY